MSNRTYAHLSLDRKTLADVKLILFLERRTLSKLVDELLRAYCDNHKEIPRELWEAYRRMV